MNPAVHQDPPYLGKLVQLRRELHAAPELGYQEFQTAKRISSWLAALDLEIETGIAGTGVVGVLRRGSGPMVGLRADMDALPLSELSDHAHASRTAGCMHACGHDGHVAMLLGAATELSRQPAIFSGSVAFLFTPAEEGGHGCLAMLEAGLLDRYPMESIYALHNWPSLPQGQFAVKSGPIMGSSLRFNITIHGQGIHAATPHLGVDPVPPLCAIVQALQTMVARECPASSSVVLSVTRLGAGDAINVVPATAWLEGSARFSEDTQRSQVEAAIFRIARSVAEAHGATAKVQVQAGYPATVNNAEETDLCSGVMRQLVGEKNVATQIPVNLTTEDFGYLLQRRPGCYALIGTGTGSDTPGLHNPHYDFNDAVLPLGIRYWVSLVNELLPLDPTRKNLPS